MSAWKRGRSWSERHGYGSCALARRIGFQCREARRFRTPEFERARADRIEWLRKLEAQAWEYYQALPASASREEFDIASRVWNQAHRALNSASRR